MDVSQLLNHTEDESFGSRWRPSEKFRRFDSTSSSSSNITRHDSFNSLTPLEHALPQLSGSSSDDSDSVRSPLTPDYTPEATPNLPYERDPKRFPRTSALLTRPRLHAASSSTSSRTSSFPSSASDSLPMSSHDYVDGIGSPNYVSFQQIQPNPYQPQLQSPSLPLTPLDQSVFTPSASRPTPRAVRKNSYPCPVAKQYNCSEHFTTSGHAARHAKKHTGKKDAICPECNKAFTRKDNMEQHRRTHAPGRANAKSSTSTDEGKQARTKLKVAQQQSQQKKKQLPAASPTMPEMPMQIMPASLINPVPNAAPTDPLAMAALDPQLRSPPMQSSFEPVSNASMAFWSATTMPYMPNQTFAASAAGAQARPKLQRSSYGDSIQNQLQPSANIRSPSSLSSVSSSDEHRSSNSSHRLDGLALAASLQQ